MIDVQIAKPCHQSWTAMKGDDKARFCGACRKHVYNISEMTEAEVEALIRRTEGHFCARLYRRTDNRVMTKDCPKGVTAVRQKRTLAVTAAFAAFVGVLQAFPVMGQSKGQARVRRLTPLPEATTRPPDFAMGAVAVPLRERPDETLGKVRPPVEPTATPGSSTR